MSGVIESTNLQTANIKHTNGTTAMTVSSGGVVAFASNPSGITIPSISKFTSAETTISASTKTTFAHGLGAVPFQFDLYLKCTSGSYGYETGDIIKVTQSYHSTAGTSDIGAIMSADATNIYLTTGGNSAGGMFKGFNQDTGAGVTFANANFKMIVKAWI